MSKRVAITGGAGFIGSAVIRELQRHGHEIYVIDNLSFGRRDLAHVSDDRFIVLDIRDRDQIASTIARINPDWLLHLAAIHFIPYCNAHPVETADINLWGTVNVLDAARAAGRLEKLLFASTAAVYMISEGAVAEDHPARPLDIYGLTKYTGERLSREFHMRTGVPVVICRLFNAFGPNETNLHLFPEIQHQVNAGARTIKLGNVDPKRDFIHTHDVARGMRMLMELADEGCDTFNLGRGIEYSVREIVQAFERQLGEPLAIEVEPSRVRHVERMHLLADVSKMKQRTGWEPEWGIDEGVRTLIAPERTEPDEQVQCRQP
jgi:UDP-glucose 4-epimerase